MRLKVGDKVRIIVPNDLYTDYVGKIVDEVSGKDIFWVAIQSGSLVSESRYRVSELERVFD